MSMEQGNQMSLGQVHGVVFDNSQLSAEEAAAAEPPKTPRPKVVAATFGAALSVVIVAILGAVGVELPPEAAVGLAPVLTLLFGYLKTD